MSAWPLLLFLLGLSQQGRAFSDTVDEVKQILSKLNIDMSRRSLSEVPLGGFRLYFPLVASLEVNEVTVGRLSTFVVRREADQHIRNHTTSDGSTNFEFDVSVGLEDIHIKYKFFYRVMLFFTKSGTVTVEARTNTIQLKGLLTQNSDGNCSAVLTAASFTDLSAYDMSIEPDGFYNTIWEFLGNIISNHIFDSWIYYFADRYLQHSISNPNFKRNFSEILCESFVQ